MIDLLIHYVVSKKDGRRKPKMKILVQSIYTYVQNHEIYFKYEPNFYNGVLVFGIVGFEQEHDALKKELGKLIDKLGCQVQYINGELP